MTVSLLYNPTLPTVTCSPSTLSVSAYDLFGGGQFALHLLDRIEDELTARARSLFGLSASTAASAPLIIVLRLVGGVLTTVQGLASLDAGKIAQGLEAIGVASADFLSLVNFPVAMARTALAIRDNLVAFLQALKTKIITLQGRYTNVNAMIAAANAAGNAAWLANAQCAKSRLDAKVSQINAMLAALGIALQLASLIICLVTGGHFTLALSFDPNNLVTGAIDTAIGILNAFNIPNVPGVVASC